MDFVPIQVLDELHVAKLLNSHHIYSLKDLNEALQGYPQNQVPFPKEGVPILKQKLQMLLDGIEAGADEPRNLEYIERFNKIPGSLLSLNGLNLITGKRGTGKTTFAFIQLLDAYLDMLSPQLVAFLDGSIAPEELGQLATYRLLHFDFRSVFNLSHFVAIVQEKAKKFVDKHFDGKKQKPGALDEHKERLEAHLRAAYCTVSVKGFEDFKSVTKEILEAYGKPDLIKVFGMILDDPSFVFNKLDHLVLKAETRAFLKLANQIIHINCTPVVLTDSVRGYIDDDNTEDLRLYCHPLLFTNVSDIVYASKNEQNLLALTLLKSSKDLIAVDYRHSHARD